MNYASDDKGERVPQCMMELRLHLHRPPGQRLPLWALLLSAMLHLGLAAVLGSGVVDGAALPHQKPATAMAVELKAADGTVRQAGMATDSALAKSASHAARTLQPTSAKPERDMDPPGSHYFEASEWTEAPLLLQDVAADQLLVSPTLTNHPLVVTLLVNEQGSIDKVEIEGSALPDFEQRLVEAAFAEVRFQPARLRGLAVKSSVKIELKLENTRLEPVPAQASTEVPSS
jgi:hypothetical protein